MAVRKDQEYQSCQPVPSMPTDHYALIRVVSDPVITPGTYGFGKVMIATVTEGGRLLRDRRISIKALHDSRTTQDGQTRKTGYYLVKDVEATDGQ